MAPVPSKPVKHDTAYGHVTTYMSGPNVVTRVQISSAWVMSQRRRMTERENLQWLVAELRSLLGSDLELVSMKEPERTTLNESYEIYATFRRNTPEPVVARGRKIILGGAKNHD